MVRYKLSPGESRVWRGENEAARHEVRREIRRAAIRKAHERNDPFVIICDPKGRELERVYRAIAVELTPEQARTWAGPTSDEQRLLQAQIVEICRRRLETDLAATSIDVRSPDGQLVVRVHREDGNVPSRTLPRVATPDRPAKRKTD